VKFPEGFWGYFPHPAHVIHTGNFIFGMGKHLTKFTIIRYQEETLRFRIQSSYREKPFRTFLDQLENRPASLVILGSAKISTRFI
jgi:hypothetical protein